MMTRLLSLLTLLPGLLLATAPASAQPARAPWATGESRGEDLTISLVTFGPGDDVPSWFGHGSLLVEDRRLRYLRLYSYGAYSFNGRTLARYMMGRLEAWAEEADPFEAFRFYRSLNRDVRLQELDLTPTQKVELARRLAADVLTENQGYLYHSYNDNCATRLRDNLDTVLDGRFKRVASAPGRMTLREHVRRYVAVNAAMSVVLDFLMNDEFDRPITRWEESFLPDELERQVGALRVVGDKGSQRPLVARSWSAFQASRPATLGKPPSYGPVLLGLGLTLGGGAVGLALWERRSGGRVPLILLGLQSALLGLGLGLPGLALSILWLGNAQPVSCNENLFLAGPLALLAPPLSVMLLAGSARARRWLRWGWLAMAGLGVLGLALKALPGFDQDNWRLIALLLPQSLGMAGAMQLLADRPVQDEDSGDISFRGDGFGCSATGGDASLVLMSLGTFLALARRRRR